MGILQTQKGCLRLELYSRQKINYSQLTECFINKTVAACTTVRTEVSIWSSVFIVQKQSVIIVLLERLRFTFTPNSRRIFLPRDDVFPLFSVYSLLLLHKKK